MTSNQRYILLGGALGVMIALALGVLFAVLLTGSDADNTKKTQVAKSTRVITEDASQENISIHGHWVVAVRDFNGRLVARREFDNDLLTSGASALADILIGSKSVKEWTVVVTGASEGKPCKEASGRSASCRITQTSAPDNNSFPNLKLKPGINGSSIEFSGVIDTQNNGTLSTVSTEILLCSVVDTSDCRTAPFSSKGLPSPLNVISGQAIVVTYTLSIP